MAVCFKISYEDNKNLVSLNTQDTLEITKKPTPEQPETQTLIS
jgi:hypothetical protein